MKKWYFLLSVIFTLALLHSDGRAVAYGAGVSCDDFELSGFSPDKGGNDGVVTIVVDGHNLSEGCFTYFDLVDGYGNYYSRGDIVERAEDGNTAQVNLDLNGLEKGYYDVDTDDGIFGYAFEVLEASADPFALYRAWPERGTDHEVSLVRVYGKGMHENGTFSLVKDGLVIPGTMINYEGPSSCEVEFDLRGRPGGYWELIAINPDGSTLVLSDEFYIYEGALLIHRIHPSSGSNTGMVTPRILADLLQDTVSVKLIKNGNEIPGFPVTVTDITNHPGRKFIHAAFNLYGQVSGLWDIRVEHPDGSYGILEDAFNIEPGGAPDVRMEIQGSMRVRSGRFFGYYLRMKNIGKANAVGIPAILVLSEAGVDMSGVQWEVHMPEYPPALFDPEDAVTSQVTQEGVMLVLPGINLAGHQSATVFFRLKFPEGSFHEFRIEGRWYP